MYERNQEGEPYPKVSVSFYDISYRDRTSEVRECHVQDSYHEDNINAK